MNVVCVTLASTRMARSQQAYLEDRRHGRIRPTRLVRRRSSPELLSLTCETHHEGVVAKKFRQVKSSHACARSRHTGVSLTAAREADGWREQQREVPAGCDRQDGDGAGGGSSEARRMLEGDDRRRMTRAGAERIGARKRVPVSVSATTTGKGPLARAGHLGERDAALTGLELLGRAGAFVPLFLSPISPHLMPDATVDLEPISSSA